MQTLINKIDDYLKAFPDSKNVSIREGGLFNIEDLLYELKEQGVVGTFRSAEIPVSTRNGLEDIVYFFDIDKGNYEKFKQKSFPNKSDFLEKESILVINDKRVELNPSTKEFALCSVLFERPAGEWMSWDEVFEEMTSDQPDSPKKNRKMVSDTCNRLNKRILDSVGVASFVSCKNQSVKRTF